MEKMNTEKKVQLLKDLAANVGYKLIAAPFDTPFVEDSFEILPFGEECKQVFWTVPESVLNSKEYEELRKKFVKADVLDSVCVTSIPWESDNDERVAILLIDLTRKHRGSVKFVDASKWDISQELGMAAVCNFLIHDVFPGEDFLAFWLDGDEVMDEYVDNRWNEQVRVVPSGNINERKGYSLLPLTYMPRPVAKQGFKYVRLDELFLMLGLRLGTEAKHVDVEDSHVEKTAFGEFLKNVNFDVNRDYIIHGDYIELVKPAIVASACGNFQPRKAIPNTDSAIVEMTEPIVLLPMSDEYDLDYLLQQLSKEDVLRQLPFRPYPNEGLDEYDDLGGVLIEVPETWETNIWERWR